MGGFLPPDPTELQRALWASELAKPNAFGDPNQPEKNKKKPKQKPRHAGRDIAKGAAKEYLRFGLSITGVGGLFDLFHLAGGDDPRERLKPRNGDEAVGANAMKTGEVCGMAFDAATSVAECGEAVGVGGSEAITLEAEADDAAEAATASEETAEAGIGRISIDESRAEHTFRDAEGHFADTPANRTLLIDTAGNSSNLLGTDKWGNDWYAKTQPDGTQVWASVREGKITNGGLNVTPRSFDPMTGLSSPTTLGQ